MNSSIEELTLLLLCLTSWDEVIVKGQNEKATMNWKNHRFEILDQLEEEGLITQGRKTVYLTEKGVKLAEELKKKYLSPG